MKSLRTGWTRKDKRDGLKSYNENQRDAEKKKGIHARTGSNDEYYKEDEESSNELYTLLKGLSKDQLCTVIIAAYNKQVFGASCVLFSCVKEQSKRLTKEAI